MTRGRLVTDSACHFDGMHGRVNMIAVFFLLAFLSLQARAQNTLAIPAPSAGTPAQSSGSTSSPTDVQEQHEQEQPANDQDSAFVFKKEVEEVILHATVLDEGRRLVTNLERTAFAIFEDGAPQAITSFRQEDVPVAMGIVIDNSESMREKRGQVNQAVLNLIRTSHPQDQVFVVNFGEDYYLDQDFTSDINLLQQALQKISTQGSTALYDAIVASSI